MRDDLLNTCAHRGIKKILGWLSQKQGLTASNHIALFKRVRHEKALISGYFELVELLIQDLEHGLTALTSLVYLIRSKFHVTHFSLLIVQVLTEERLLRCKS